MKSLIIILLLSPLSFATNFTVKAGGGGNFTTIQACATAMAAGDTCTVFAGTYSESPSIPAGSVGLYKTITINGSDVVNVTGGFTLASHTKVFGFVLNHTGTCFSLGSTATDVFIGNNTLTSCSTLGIAQTNSFIYFQGNTWAYAGCVPPNPSHTCGRAINVFGSNVVIENNDFSHYQLCIVYGSTAGTTVTNVFIRNNTFHDQFESEAGSNQHSDATFSEDAGAVSNIVIEGNYQYNAVGPNAKGFLDQNDSGCGATCNQLIIRFNQINRTGSGAITNDKTWPFVKLYNNTFVDEGQESPFVTPGGGGDNMASTGSGQVAVNNIWYTGTQTSGGFNSYNPVQCNSCTLYGHSIYFCATGTTCSPVYSHLYQSGTFTGDPGNLHADPLFVNYIGLGNVSNNFHLQSGSPARNSGFNLTTVNGTIVNSTTLVVADARVFQDTYGITSPNSTLVPDCISVTTISNHVCITAVNYSTNTLTLASPISATNGASVWLYSKSDGVQVLTDTTAPDMGALPFSSGGSPSFTASPTTIPAHHAGNITVTLTGVGTAWSGSTVFSIAGVTGASLVNSTNNSATSQTLKITTGSGTGTLTITDTTDAISATISVATATLAISPTSGLSGTTPTLTMTGTNTLWLSETPAGLFTVTGGTGSSIGTPTVTSNTAATVVLTPGSSAGSETITDTSTTATATFSVSAPPVLTIIVSGSGTETSSPAGIACPPTCSATFAPGTAITLTPTPGSGTGPVGWTGSACPSTAIVCKLTLNSNQTVTALFGICAAPNYCGNTSTANVPTFVAPFSAASPVNSIGYGTALNSPPLVPYTRITDRTTFNGASVGNNSCGGGAFERMCSVNDVRCFVSTSGGFAYALELNLSGSFGQLINTGTLPTTDRVVCPVVTSFVSDSISYGIGSNSSPPFISINQSTWPGNNTHTTVSLVDIGSGTTCPGIPAGQSTHVGGFSVGQNDASFGMDLSYTGGQDTGAWGVIWSPTLGCATANFAPSGPAWSAGTVYTAPSFITPTAANAGGFTYEVKTAGTGGSSAPAWNQTLGASVTDGTAVLVNIGIAGAYYAFCTSSCTPTTPKTGLMATASTCTTGTNCSCWGGYIHNSQMSADGTDLSISFSDGQVMSAGACSGHTSSALRTDWAPGTANTQWGHANGTDAGGDFYDGHPIFGVNHVVSAGGTGYYYRSIANIINLTQFQSIPSSLCGNESHISWPNPLSIDNYPAIFATSELPASGCGTNNAPLAFGNEVYAGFPQAVNQPFVRLAQTFSCNPNNALWVPCAGGSDVQFACANGIVTTTNSGNYALIASGMLLGLGLDSSSQPACDLFIAKIGGAPPRPAPTNTVLMGKSHYGIEPILNQGASR